MPKIALFSDIHIHNHSGSSEKLDNCLACLEWIYSEVEKRNISSLIFAGDLFHTRDKINVFSYHKVYDILEKYKDKINSYYLVGNHDMFYRDIRTVVSTRALSNLVRIITEPETIEIENRLFDFLPYTEDPTREINESFNNSKAKVLVSHLAIENSVLNTLWGVKNLSQNDFEEEIGKIKIDSLSRYTRVFLGHYHARQIIENIEYIGSPLQLSFGEAMDQKGFLILDSKTLKTEFVENTFSPKYFILPIDEVENVDIRNSYVRLYVPDIGKTDILDLKKKIKEDNNLKHIEIHPISVKNEVGKKEIENIESISLDHKFMVSEYVKNVDVDLDRDLLVKCSLHIINSVEQEVSF